VEEVELWRLAAGSLQTDCNKEALKSECAVNIDSNDDLSSMRGNLPGYLMVPCSRRAGETGDVTVWEETRGASLVALILANAEQLVSVDRLTRTVERGATLPGIPAAPAQHHGQGVRPQRVTPRSRTR
jgi:hypothetical protein